MGYPGGKQRSWKDRLLNSLHPPWFLRTRSTNGTITTDSQNKSIDPYRRKRRAPPTARILGPQSQCTFLNRLPGEIRNTIYLLLLGDRRLCVYQKGLANARKLTHVEWSREQAFAAGEKPRPNNKLNFLQTCRQIYLEAGNILYTTNAFLQPVGARNDIQVFNHFAKTISPSCLALITRLHIYCKVDRFEPSHYHASAMFKLWETMWAIISQKMSGLRHLTLQLRLKYLFEMVKLTAETYWVKPFLQVRNLETFDLFADLDDLSPWNAEEMAIKVERLKRYSKDLLCSRY